MAKPLSGNRSGMRESRGFTLLELVIVLFILGVLAAVSIPNVMRYRNYAELAALKAELNVLMSAEDAYYIAQGKYFPVNGTINIPSGVERKIPELGFTFKNGHRHRYYLYGYDLDYGSTQYSYCYVIVYADRDYDGNGFSDVFYCLTYVSNGRMIYHRQLYQLL